MWPFENLVGAVLRRGLGDLGVLVYGQAAVFSVPPEVPRRLTLHLMGVPESQV